MKAMYRALLVAYIAALAVNSVRTQGTLSSFNGNYDGNYNLGSNNGFGNGQGNLGSYNGNYNGNQNTGNLNGVGNGLANLGAFNGNNNGNLNFGSSNGQGNGVLNTGSNNGNANGNGNRGSFNGRYNGIGNEGDGNGNNNGNANGAGDPIFTDFAGRAFEFEGTPGQYYNILSEGSHQVSTKLKVGVMWDHNGTYMEGIGFHYRTHQIVVELSQTDPDTLTVTLDGAPLTMKAGQNEIDHIVESADVKTELTINWMLHRSDYGDSVELQTEAMKVLIWTTPAGTVDEGGVEQPSYLNFDVTLLTAPANNAMEGIVGETYARMLAGAKAVSDPEHPLYIADDFQFHGAHGAEEYAMAGYFDEGHALSLFGKKVAASSRRMLIEGAAGKAVTFPVAAGGGRDNGLRRRRLMERASITAEIAVHAGGSGLIRQSEAEASGGRRGRF